MEESKVEEKQGAEDAGYGAGKSPSEIYRELGPTALFLRTTTARKAAVLQASKEAKEAEEENARLAAQERRRQIQSILQEASLAGEFRLQPTLPRLQSGRSQWQGFLRRRSVLGLSFDDLLESESDGARGSAAHNKRPEQLDADIAQLNERLLRSPKTSLSFEALQKAVPVYDSDYRTLFSGLNDKRLRRAVSAFTSPSQPQRDPREFSSDRALLRRERLKHSQRIRALVTLFWLAADTDRSNTMTREKYLLLNRKLQIGILGIYDPGFGAELAARDWELDSEGELLAPFDLIFCSLFFLVDMYAKRIDEDAYCDFLAALAQRTIRLEAGTSTMLAFRADTHVIPRKTFEFIRAENPKWTAFALPQSASECRKLYGQSSEEIEDVLATAAPNRQSDGLRGPSDLEDGLHLGEDLDNHLDEKRSTCTSTAGRMGTSRDRPLSRSLSRGLESLRERAGRRSIEQKCP